MAFSHLFQFTGITTGLTLRLTLTDELDVTINFADGDSQKTDASTDMDIFEKEATTYYAFSSQWPVLPFIIEVRNDSGGALLSSTAVNAADVFQPIPGVNVPNNNDLLPEQPVAASWQFDISDLGDISDRTKLYLTIKANTTDTDANALVQIEETAGLLFINKTVAGTAGNGTMVVAAASQNGTVRVTLAAVESLKLAAVVDRAFFDVKVIRSSGAENVLASGRVDIVTTATQAIT